MKSTNIYYFLLIIAVCLFPIIIQSYYYISLAICVGLYSIVAMGSVILIGYAGQVSLGQSAFYAIGGYTSGLLTAKLGFPFWTGFIAAIIFSAFIGFLIGLVALRVKGNYLAIATAGFSILVYVIVREFNLLTGGVAGLRHIPLASIGTFQFDNELRYFYLVWTILIILFVLSGNLINSGVGRAMIAMKYDEEAAEVFGISIVRHKIIAFIISSCYSAVGGVLLAHYTQFIDPSAFHLSFSLTILFIVVIGGLESLRGAILGSLFIVLLPEIFKTISTLHFLPFRLRSLLTDYSYILIIVSLITILILIFLPKGVGNLFSNRK